LSTKRQIAESHGAYFITITCHQWLPLFELTSGYDIVYKWFDHLKTKGHYLVGYVTMPNHLHALIAFTKSDISINTIIGNGKRFMAYEIVKRLKEKGNEEILNKLVEAVSSREYKRGKLHEVFEPSFDWKECISNRFTNQKLNYIHDNPCRGKWNLINNPMDYAHSSARFYLTGEQGCYQVIHAGKLEDVDLSGELTD
jgi:REP element-mobilizing transposase RayT